MPAIIEAPAPATAKAPAPAAASGAPAGLVRPSSADEPANLSGQALTSALSQAARSRRAGPAEVAAPTAPPKPNGPAKEPAAAAPASGQNQGTEPSNAASTPEQPGAEPEGTSTVAAADAAAGDTPADPASEGTPADPEDGEPADDPKPESKGLKALQKRVDKLTARLRRYEEQYGPMEGQPSDATPKPTPVAAHPSEHPDIAQLDREMAEYQSHLDWMDANPDGGEYRDHQNRLLGRVDPEKIPAMKREAERRIAELTARRAYRVEQVTAQAQQAMRQADQEAVQRYPWLSNPEAPEHQHAQQILAELPRSVVTALSAVPKARLLLGALVEGLKPKAQPKAAAATRPVPPKVMAPAASAAPVASPASRLQADLAEAEAAFKESGSVEDQKRVLKIKRQIRMGS